MNKFDIEWQLVRTHAKSEEYPAQKIQMVMGFLKAKPNIFNRARVVNWLKMTAHAYGDPKVKQLFKAAEDEVETLKFSTEDNTTTLKDTSTEDLEAVYKDLSKRKYGFQFKTVPKAHTEFMGALEAELQSRSKGNTK